MGSVTSAELAAVMKRLSVDGVAPSVSQSRLERALNYARELYADRKHHSGVGVIEHALQTLEVLAPFHPDEDTVIAVLLHHALDDRRITLTELQEQFGPVVRSLVGSVHLLSHVTLQARRARIDDLRLMLLSVSDDIRTVLIILCDRTAVLRMLEELPIEDRKIICRDVLQLFAPVAARLGIYSLKHELENRAFPVMYPSDAERIAEQIVQLEEQNGMFLDATVRDLKTFFRGHKITVHLESRRKETYSIFAKMREKSITHIRDLFDFYALRIIVPDAPSCYQVLGFLHQIARPIQQRFKDYIAFPKPNGYQSLHTTLTELPDMPGDAFVEVQIRTHEMHREAQYGVAAHWAYKEGSTAGAARHAHLQQILVSQEPITGKLDPPYADHIFVLTPRGDVVELPEGATPLDFAFQVHTDLGIAFSSARVNGSVAPLSYRLTNGDVVEIIKQSPPRPSPRWMQVLRLASSRTKLKRYLSAIDRPQLIIRGRELLNAELREHHLPPLDTSLSILKVCDGHALTVVEREDLLAKIGQGADRAHLLLKKLPAVASSLIPEPAQAKKKSGPRLQRKDSEIVVEGNVRMPTRYAKCCKPEEAPREEVCGVINRSGTVMVHRDKCKMLRHSNKGRRVGVVWRG
ncbi:MAG: HD domain-containing protein [Candidatus Peregrinibacteria bacterium]